MKIQITLDYKIYSIIESFNETDDFELENDFSKEDQKIILIWKDSGIFIFTLTRDNTWTDIFKIKLSDIGKEILRTIESEALDEQGNKVN